MAGDVDEGLFSGLTECVDVSLTREKSASSKRGRMKKKENGEQDDTKNAENENKSD